MATKRFKTMKIFKLIEIDIEAERKRVEKCGFNQHQKKALLKLYDLFEAGRWKECINHVRDKRAFPYSRSGEYPETEHIGIEVSAVLRELGDANFFTQDELLRQAAEKLRGAQAHQAGSEKKARTASVAKNLFRPVV